MVKIHTYGSMRTAPAEYIATTANTLNVGDLAVISSGKIVAAGSEVPTYLVIGKAENGQIPVTAILDDMVLEGSTVPAGFIEVASFTNEAGATVKRFRKDTAASVDE